MPDGTFTRTGYDAWMSRLYDANDTVIDSAWYAALGSPDPMGPEPADPGQRAAWLAAMDYNTPATTYVDALDRGFYSQIDYGNGVTAATYQLADATGRYGHSYDELGRLVASTYSNLLGHTLYTQSAERGSRWFFPDAGGRMAHLWDNAISEMWSSYDVLSRPLSVYQLSGGRQQVISHIVYGDLYPSATAETLNLKGRAYQIYDPAGVATIGQIDFKGNILSANRTLNADYTTQPDWTVIDGLTDIAAIQTAAAPLLETEAFTTAVTVVVTDNFGGSSATPAPHPLPTAPASAP